MYRRFLNDNDYLSVISPEALSQITRGNAERLAQAEESAEMSVVEHLSENYEIERELTRASISPLTTAAYRSPSEPTSTTRDRSTR